MTTPTASELCVVDSSGWVEYFGDGPKAEQLDPYFSVESFLLTPALVLFEVYRKLTQTRGGVLVERLRPERPETRVLFISGYTDDTIVHHGVSHGDAAFLQKPFSRASLLKKVRSVLDN